MDEARAKVALRRAELARLTDRINYEVQEAFERVRETDEVVKLYDSKVLPAAAANVKEAESAYTNNKVPFLNLVEARRNASRAEGSVLRGGGRVRPSAGRLERAGRRAAFAARVADLPTSCRLDRP